MSRKSLTLISVLMVLIFSISTMTLDHTGYADTSGRRADNGMSLFSPESRFSLRNSDSQNMLSLLETFPFGTSYSDMSELFEADPSLVFDLENGEYFCSYTLRDSVYNFYPGKVTCYFLEDKLGCVLYELDKDECLDYKDYFNDMFEAVYPDTEDKPTSHELDSLVLWTCFPYVIGAYYMVWEIYENTFSEIWDYPNDTMAAIFYDDERAFAIIASKTESSNLWDWYLYGEKILAQNDNSGEFIPEPFMDDIEH